MNVIRFFVSYWRKIGLNYAGPLFGLVFLLSISNGLAHTGLLVLIGRSLKAPDGQPPVSIPLFVALCIVVPLTLFLSENLLIGLGNRVIYALHVDFSQKVLATPLRALEKIGLHRLQGVMTEDVRNISNAMLGSMMITTSLTVILGCLFYLGWLSWKMLMLFLGFLVVGLVWYQILSEKSWRAFQKARSHYDGLLAGFRSLTEGIKELKLNFARREMLAREVNPAAAGYRGNLLKGNLTLSFAGATSQALYFVLIGLMIFWAPKFKNVNMAVITGATLVTLYLMKYIFTSIGMLGTFFSAGASIQNTQALALALTESQDTGAEPLRDASDFRELRLSGVTYSYYSDEEEKTFALGPLDLTFQPGQITFLNGGNGSGKTTLAKVISGLYAPESGTVSWNGETITDANRDSYRQQFAAVFLDFFLFDKLYGLSSEDLDQKARNYLRELELDHKVTVDGHAISTLSLSHGQRKRLALLTAYLEDRPFYIFDEWASDQDPAFREVFYTRILQDLKAKGKAVLVITHDRKYLRAADRILTSDYGRIAST